ncbi:hypothetical protein GE09DRAFT_1219127 [Coniochaeta sp. 2T2.1]|nr:hypothetical protein GE09DRAFT_1219127 [Coniochaeta sp. 2T2.1]
MPTGDGEHDCVVEPPEELPPYYDQASPLTQVYGAFEQDVRDLSVIVDEYRERYERVYPCLECEEAQQTCRGKTGPKCTRCKGQNLDCCYPERDLQPEQCSECHKAKELPEDCNNSFFNECDRCKREKLGCKPVKAVKAVKDKDDHRCQECKHIDKSPCDRSDTNGDQYVERLAGEPPCETTPDYDLHTPNPDEARTPGVWDDDVDAFNRELDDFRANHQPGDTPAFDPTVFEEGFDQAEYYSSPHLQQPEDTDQQQYEVSSQSTSSSKSKSKDKGESKDKGKGKRQHASTPSTGSTSSHHRRGQPSKRSRGEQRATDAAEYASGANTSGLGYEEQEQQQYETEDSPHEALRAMSLYPEEQGQGAVPVPQGPCWNCRDDPVPKGKRLPLEPEEAYEVLQLCGEYTGSILC